MRMILKSKMSVAAVMAVGLMATACGSPAENEAIDGVTVVATTTMLGDIARNIVGGEGSVEVLFPVGASPHDFNPSSAQVTSIYRADVVLANGLHLEEGLEDVLSAAEADGVNVLHVGERVDPLTFVEREPCDTDEGDHSESHAEHGSCDPHVWFDPDRVAQIAHEISRSLASVDSSVAWNDRAEDYAADLQAADDEIVELLDVIPADERLLVTNHDSFGYFADRYGFVVVGTVIPGGSMLSEPSSVDLAELVTVLNETRVSAIFTETSEPSALADAIAGEVDHDVEVIALYTGSLGEKGSGAETLIGMLLTNAERIANGLS